MALLGTFMVDAYTALGGLAEVSSGVLEAVGPAGGAIPESVRLWVGDGACPDDEDMLHLGHPALEATLAAVRAEACCGVRHLAVARRRVGVEALARQALGFRNARVTFGEEGTAAVPVVVLWYRVTFTWDERREDLVRVAIDTQTGRVFDAELLDRAYLEAGPSVDTEVRLEGVEEAARAELGRRVEARAAALERAARRHLEVERARLEDYYRGVLADLARRGRGADASRQEALAAKRASTEADLETRRRDLEDKYRVQVSARLCAVERIDIPRARVSVRLEGRRAAREAVVSYSFLTRALDPWSCEGCGRALSGVYLCREGHLVCVACASECEGCRGLACRACGAGKCELCPTVRCPTCDGACEACGRGTCRRHRGDCHKVVEAPSKPAPASKERASGPSPLSKSPAPVSSKPAPSRASASSSAERGRAWTIPRLAFQIFGGWCARHPHVERALRPVDACLSAGDLRGAADALGRLIADCRPGPLRERAERMRTILLRYPANAVQMLGVLVLNAPKATDPIEKTTSPGRVFGPRATLAWQVVEAILDQLKVSEDISSDARDLLERSASAIEGSPAEVAGWAGAVAYEALRGEYDITMADLGKWVQVSAPTINNRVQAVRKAAGRFR